MIDVPSRFKPHIRWEYPPNNKIIFEEWFFDRYDKEDNKSDRVYLPVFPTSYQVNSKYGKDKSSMQRFDRYFQQLDKRKKYFVICQYDDGILCKTHGLDIKVFGSGGGHIDFPIPLMCQPHPFKFESNKSVFASFRGAMNHPIRNEMFAVLKGNDKYDVSDSKLPIQHYCELMSKSIFALCPRGYGQSSFRICEALQYESIPIYISDHFIIPFNKDFNEYGLTISSDQVGSLDEILSSIPLCDIFKKREAGKKAYAEMFTYEGCYKQIIETL
jgi:hypothetical protein